VKKILNKIIPIIVIALIATILLSSAVYAATWGYKYPIIITDTSGTTRTYVPVMLGFAGQNLVNAAKIGSDGLDSNIQAGTTSIQYTMSTTQVATVVPLIPDSGKVTIDFYTGYSPEQTSFPIIVGNNGYFTVNDNASLEPSGNFTSEFTDIYLTTDNGTSKDILSHYDVTNGGLQLFVSPTVSGNVTARIITVTGATSTAIPNATGNYTNFGVYTNVDDPVGTPDEDTTYNDTVSTTFVKSAYNLATPTLLGTNQIINSVNVTMRAREFGASDGFLKPGLWLSGAEVLGSEVAITNDVYADYSQTIARPGGGAWAISDLTDLQVVSSGRNSSSGTTYVTQVYITVNYTYETYADVTATGITTGEYDVSTSMESPFFAETIESSGTLFTPVDGETPVVSALSHYKAFNGVDSYLEIPYSANLDFGAGSFTVETWFNLNTALSPNRGIVTQYMGANYWMLQIDSQDLTFMVNADITGAYHAALNTWYHVVAIRDVATSTLKLYVNDSLVSSVAGANGSVSTIGDIEIGSREHVANRMFNGSIGGTYVYKGVALTPAQVAAQYAKGVPPASLTPVVDDLVLNAPLFQDDCSTSPFTTVDTSAFTATTHNAPIWTLDTGYTLDGVNQHITIPDHASLDMTDVMTAEVWFKRSALGTFDTLLSKSAAGATGWDLRISDTNVLQFYMYEADADLREVNSGATTIGIGIWHQITAVADGTNLKLYLDGAILATGDAYSDIQATAVELHIGIRNDNFGPAGGDFGETRVYHKAFTPAEVLQNYNATKCTYDGSTNHDILSTMNPVPNSTANWTFVDNSVMSYVERISYSVGGIQQLSFAPVAMITGSTLPNLGTLGSAGNGTITWGTNTGLTISYGEMQSYASYIASANITFGFTMPEATMPSTWFSAGESVSNLPFYDMISGMATSSGVPAKTIYAWIIIGLAFFMFASVIMYTKSAFMGVIAMDIVFFVGSSMTIVPMWIPFVVLLVDFGIMYLFKQVSY